MDRVPSLSSFGRKCSLCRHTHTHTTHPSLPILLVRFLMPDMTNVFKSLLGLRVCRPGLRNFLYHAAKLYELHIYTHGRRPYAEVILHILDPDHRFSVVCVHKRDTPLTKHVCMFGHTLLSYSLTFVTYLISFSSLFKRRLLSIDDTPGLSTKDLQRMFPCDESMVSQQPITIFFRISNPSNEEFAYMHPHRVCMRACVLCVCVNVGADS
jgi:hypothetical protein